MPALINTFSSSMFFLLMHRLRPWPLFILDFEAHPVWRIGLKDFEQNGLRNMTHDDLLSARQLSGLSGDDVRLWGQIKSALDHRAPPQRSLSSQPLANLQPPRVDSAFYEPYAFCGDIRSITGYMSVRWEGVLSEHVVNAVKKSSLTPWKPQMEKSRYNGYVQYTQGYNRMYKSVFNMFLLSLSAGILLQWMDECKEVLWMKCAACSESSICTAGRRRR